MPVLYKPFQSTLEDKKVVKTLLSPSCTFGKRGFRTTFERNSSLLFPLSG